MSQGDRLHANPILNFLLMMLMVVGTGLFHLIQVAIPIWILLALLNVVAWPWELI